MSFRARVNPGAHRLWRQSGCRASLVQRPVPGLPSKTGSLAGCAATGPDGRDRLTVRGLAEGSDPLDIEQCSQHIIVVNPFGIVTGLDVCPVKQRENVISEKEEGFVKGHDEQAVVVHGPAGIGGNLRFNPFVGPGDGPIVHVIVVVGNDKGYGRQF